MRLRTSIFAAIAIAFGLPLVASSLCRAQEAPDSEIFSALQRDILTFVPDTQQTSFLVRVALADRFLFPPTTALPPNPCAAIAQLDSIASSTQGLATAQRISQAGEEAILGDVSRLVVGIQEAHPPNPCFHVSDFGG